MGWLYKPLNRHLRLDVIEQYVTRSGVVDTLQPAVPP
jgi:hypothetical protein